MLLVLVGGRILGQSQRQPADSPTPPDSKVVLGPVFKVAADPVPLYRVSYTYEFPGRSDVYIRGAGRVPSRGSFSYFYAGDSIEFLDGPQGRVLRAVAIQHPITLMGDRAPNIPDEAQFPAESRSGRWQGPEPFAGKALKVLDQAFRYGYRVYEKEQRVFYLTTYTDVPVAVENTRVEVSVLISLASKAESPDTPFALRFKAQERRSHTDWRDSLSDPSRLSVEAFVDRLLATLQH